MCLHGIIGEMTQAIAAYPKRSAMAAEAVSDMLLRCAAVEAAGPGYLCFAAAGPHPDVSKSESTQRFGAQAHELLTLPRLVCCVLATVSTSLQICKL